jgi:hypothetical protein
MKNTFKIFGIIVLVTVIMFSMSACGDDDDSDNGSSGKLTISNLPAGGPYSITVHNATYPNHSEANMEAGGTGNSSPISLMAPPNYTSAYNGSGSRLVILMPDGKYTAATFSNGSATVDYNTMTE